MFRKRIPDFLIRMELSARDRTSFRVAGIRAGLNEADIAKAHRYSRPAGRRWRGANRRQ